MVSGLIKKGLIFLVEDVSMFWHIGAFIAAVVCFGVTYTLLTQCDHGIGRDYMALDDATIFTGIYFSIVTISSLGYGDMHPMGISRVLACIEVLFGLVMIGVMIAKVTSQRLSYRVERLFSSDAQKQLERFDTKFASFRGDFEEVITNFGDAYEETLGETPLEDKSVLIARFQKIITAFQSQCTVLHTYFSDETSQGNYFEIAPASTMVQVGNTIDEAFFSLGQLLTSLSPQAKIEVLDRRSRQDISRAIDAQIKVCDLVDQHATDQDTCDVFQAIQDICRQLSESYFAEVSQPDQLLRDPDEPQ